MTNILRRIEFLERKDADDAAANEPLRLIMPDGTRETIRGRGDYCMALLKACANGEDSPEVRLIGESVDAIGINVSFSVALLEFERSDFATTPFVGGPGLATA